MLAVVSKCIPQWLYSEIKCKLFVLQKNLCLSGDIYKTVDKRKGLEQKVMVAGAERIGGPLHNVGTGQEVHPLLSRLAEIVS